MKALPFVPTVAVVVALAAVGGVAVLQRLASVPTPSPAVPQEFPPPAPAGVRDPFGVTLAGQVQAFVNTTVAAQEAGIDSAKVDLRTIIREVEPRHWAIDVSFTGFRGDLPAAYR